ncbi:hypothetical protein CSV75_01830 [Sporosarcina sp. P18a]|uniref:hypothetical protein n=1 Tax=Sporosarcina sp. P18a TaxID=2048259 RepID=UPI000C16A393|nr:hypothetical protein [Sporosarcina sp. P18a]PIC80556.1 hypothetical protein CSV75_01830 [Sporosarcina sp. P18a]
MEFQEYLGIGSILATIIVGVISWWVSSYVTKKSLKRQKLNYEIKLYPIISKGFLNKSDDLQIHYQEELLPDPTLLAVDIINSGNVAIENPPIEIKALGATYIIPGYIEEIPAGYEELWELTRTDAEACAVKLAHINPGQIVKARFFLNELPSNPPVFQCPMKDLELQEVNTEMKQIFMNSLLSTLPFSSLGRSIRELNKYFNNMF